MTSKVSPLDEQRRLVLGARAFIHYTATRDLDNALNTFDEKDRPDIEQYFQVVACTDNELETFGRKAEERGYLRSRTEKSYQFVLGKQISVFRSVKTGWNSIDGTIPCRDDDQSKRYQLGVANRVEPLCTVEACLFAGLRLDAGRLQIDQISAKALLDLQRDAPVAAAMRKALVKHWGKISQEERTAMGLVLGRILQRQSSTLFPKGEHITIGDVVVEFFKHLPQVSFTTVQAEFCCDSVLNVRKDSKAMRRSCIHLPPLFGTGTVQQQLTELFAASVKSGDANTAKLCTTKGVCLKERREVHVVLDRLPPTLLVVLGNKDDKAIRRGDIFDDITLDYIHVKQHKQIHYKVVGAIFRRGSHYLTHWRADRVGDPEGSFVQVNGISSDRARAIKDWWDSDSPDARFMSPQVLFFRIK